LLYITTTIIYVFDKYFLDYLSFGCSAEKGLIWHVSWLCVERRENTRCQLSVYFQLLWCFYRTVISRTCTVTALSFRVLVLQTKTFWIPNCNHSPYGRQVEFMQLLSFWKRSAHDQQPVYVAMFWQLNMPLASRLEDT